MDWFIPTRGASRYYAAPAVQHSKSVGRFFYFLASILLLGVGERDPEVRLILACKEGPCGYPGCG